MMINFKIPGITSLAESKSERGFRLQKKALTLAITVIISTSVLGLFFISQDFNILRIYSENSRITNLPQDTIRSPKTNPEDSIFRIAFNAGDAFEKLKDYNKAIGEFEKALKIKPNAPGLKERIAKLKSSANEQSKNIEESNKAMTSGDEYFAKKDYLNAKAAYQLAIDAYPDNKSARDKMQKTMELLRSQKAQNILFDVAVASADKLFQAGEYEKAKAEYENAGKLLPGDPYPKNRINEIIKIQVDNKVKNDEYDKAIASGDKSFGTNNLQLALLDYKKAAGIKPSEKYPQQKIKEINDLLAAQKLKDDAYNKAIATADQQFQSKFYPEAVKSYREALTIKPEQVYPKNKIAEIEGLLARNKKAKEDYDHYIAEGDSLYIEKQYMRARENYTMASSVKPNESYPKEMIAKADKMLTGQEAAMAKALDERYSKIIALADKLKAQNEIEPARAEYVKASNLKPAENYPKVQIKAIDDANAATLRNKDEAYQKAIAEGDKLLANRVLNNARNEYQKALDLKPGESYPKTKLAEVDKLLAIEMAQKAEDARYTDAIATGDSLFFVKAYQAARQKFVAALTIKPKEAYPRNRIAEIDAAFAEIEKDKARTAEYNNLVALADKAMQTKQYQPAKDNYTKASGLKPDEMYPKEKLAELDRIFTELEAARTLEADYKKLIVQADKQFAEKSYPEARVSYENAAKLKPSETYPSKRIAEIEKILLDLAAKKSADENYQSLISSADKLLSEKLYPQAKEEYQKALGIKPNEQYPKSKITEIDLVLADIAKKKALDDEYTSVISNADQLLASNSLPEAKARYQQAVKMKPSESYPQEKIASIDKLLAEKAAQKALDEKYQATVKNADDLMSKKMYSPAKDAYNSALTIKPDEKYPKSKISEIEKILSDQKTLEENYQATITRADQLLNNQDYETAKAEYNKALELKPDQKYPRTQIAEIEKILSEIARKNALDKEYTGIISEADQLLSAKSFAESKTKYQSALKLKPGEKYPVEKITEIDNALAEIARLKSIDDRFNASLQKADGLLQQKSYDQAKAEYQQALTIKPGEKYPGEKIIAIDKILADIAAAKVITDRYQDAVNRADQLLGTKSYNEAKKEYSNAKAIKPGETYPDTKIAEIDKALADIEAERKLNEDYEATIKKADQALAAKSYQSARTEFEKALGIKSTEVYPKNKISEIEAILSDIAKKKAVDDEYNANITSGNQLLGEKSWESAREKFQKALELKPAETLPKTKIAECDKALADVARQKATDDQYKEAIAEADQLFLTNDYDKAKEKYQQAGKIKPAETYPGTKIKEIDGILAEKARQKAIDDQYTAAITKGDQQFKAKAWEPAKSEYNAALKLKPGEQYPKDKIGEIESVLAELKAKEDSWKAAIASGDQLFLQKKYEEARNEYEKALEIKPQDNYAKGKIADINKAMEELMGKQKFYDNLISDGDQLFVNKDFPKAKETYQRASGVFPDKTYPKDRIALINNKMDSIYKANKVKYDKVIADADRFYTNFEFDKAIDAYTEAANLLPMENYPKEMIVKIRKVISENAIVDVMNSTVTINSNDEKRFSFTPVEVASRKNNFIYVKIKNLSGKPFNVLVRFGKDKQSNGGVVMRNISVDGRVNERLVSVRDQDLWSRIDNDWIGIIPQGGDVEVSFIQVSRAKTD